MFDQQRPLDSSEWQKFSRHTQSRSENFILEGFHFKKVKIKLNIIV